MKDLSGKTVVITGAGRGLGAALCLQFGKAGAFIAACDIDEGNLSVLSSRLQSENIGHMTAHCDIANEASVQAFFKKLKDLGKSTFVLVNNAGITSIKLFRDNTNEEIRRVMDINFMGCVYTTRSAYEDVVANKGSFIAISSVAGFAPLIGRTAYSASKHAVQGFFETLRTEVKHQGVHVLVVCPGFIDTELRTHAYSAGEDNKTTRHKVGGNASPEQVAGLIFNAWQKRRPMLVTGIGRASYIIKRFFPQTYESLMTRKLKGGFDL